MPVALMTIADAIAAVRSATAHDNDTQVTSLQITAELDREYRRVRRWLSSFVPSLYQKSATFTLTSLVTTIAKPDDLDSILKLEVDCGQGNYAALSVRPALHSSEGPVRDVSGVYRLTYASRPVDGYTSLDVPDGAVDIIIHRVSAWVRQRHEESYKFHVDKANEVKEETRLELSRRYGFHQTGGLLSTFGVGSVGSFFEEGANIIII